MTFLGKYAIIIDEAYLFFQKIVKGVENHMRGRDFDKSSLELMKNYKRLFFDEKKTPKEIFEMFGVGDANGYRLVRKISEQTGIPRKDLLFRPHKEHEAKKARKRCPVTTPLFDFDFDSKANELLGCVRETKAEIRHWIREDHELMKGERA